METISTSSIELIYSEDRQDIIHSPGLRIEADILLQGSLQPVGKALFYLLGEKDVAPKGLHPTAHLSSKRDWSEVLNVITFYLQGSFEQMSFRIGEVSTTKVWTFGGPNRWQFRYGFFGSARHPWHTRYCNAPSSDLPPLQDRRTVSNGYANVDRRVERSVRHRQIDSESDSTLSKITQ